MRSFVHPVLELGRAAIAGHVGAGLAGAFIVRSGTRADVELEILSSGPMTTSDLQSPYGWEHVSLKGSTYGRLVTPTWDEMSQVKGLFWEDEECVVQYHPPRSEYVNEHEHVLHLWKPVGYELPLPPREAIA